MSNLLDRKLLMIEDYSKQREELFFKLKESLAIKGLWSGAFDYPGTSAVLDGNHRELKTMNFKIFNEKESLLFPLKDIPNILRKDHLDRLEKRLVSRAKQQFQKQRKLLDW